MDDGAERTGRLLAVSDIHVGHNGNWPLVEALEPTHPDDWLIVAGDVAETSADIRRALTLLRERFAAVIWTPGNHELWTAPHDPVRLRGVERYQHLVEMCRELDVITPEDPFPVWRGAGGPVMIAPLFVLYDYSFRVPDVSTKAESLAKARAAGVVCTDEYYLRPDPYASIDAWCDARLEETLKRLEDLPPDQPTVLVNHYPLVRDPTAVLRYPLFAQWCGTDRTADWHQRFRATVMVYGHLHIPRTTFYDGVRFEEVSLGYPREWARHGRPVGFPRQILPEPSAAERPPVSEKGFVTG